ncbi:HET-domain-containing protein, partial [Ophiobolus disseminans]
WLENCENNHPKCNKYKSSDRPSRILKIDLIASPTAVRLLSVEATPFHGRYAALSHRWPATTSPSLLTKSNIKQYQESLPILQLPKNFVDAVEITKALGLQHLWIDSLCIMQDSTVDWETESAKMDRVYLNAAVTIAACTLRSTYASQFGIPDSPLSKRGWVLQEMALSPRVVHFTQDQAYWQCREKVESEDGTLCIPHADGGPVGGHLEERLDRALLVPNIIPKNDLPRLWWS